MLAALLLASGCWRPDAYEPPPALPVEDEGAGTPVGDEEEEAGDHAEADEGEAPGEAGEPEAGAAAEPEELEEEEPPPFPAYAGRTLQAPVTIVDDYGRPLSVIALPGFAVEVRGEETARVRVWCAACKPPVEGWIQAHLVTRADGTPTGGSK